MNAKNAFGYAVAGRAAADEQALNRIAGDAIGRAIGVVLDNIGENPRRDGLLETPARVAKALLELTSGYHVDPAGLLKTFDNDGEYDEMVLVKDIPFYSLCEHHMLPFFGVAHIAYLPTTRIVGLSKFARLVDAYGRRLQVQERLTAQIAATIEEVLDPVGVMVVVEAQHFCMSMRGVQKPGSSTVTSAVRGAFKDNPASRAECMALLTKGTRG